MERPLYAVKDSCHPCSKLNINFLHIFFDKHKHLLHPYRNLLLKFSLHKENYTAQDLSTYKLYTPSR